MSAPTRGTAIAIGFAGAAAVLLTPAAHANGATPFMYFTAFHLLFGNAIIGLVEGMLIGLLFRRPIPKCIAVMVLANYASAWLGSLALGTFGTAATRHGATIESVQWMTVAAIAGTFVLTLLVEWPFAAFCVRKQPHWFRRSVIATLAVQSISYTALVLIYVSNGSFGAPVVDAADLRLPDQLWLYFISSDDGRLHARRLSDPSQVWIAPEGLPVNAHRLGLSRPSGASEPTALLMGVSTTGDWHDAEWKRIADGIPADAAPVYDDHRRTFGDPGSIWQLHDVAGRFAQNADAPWTFHVSYWPEEGVTGDRESPAQRRRFAVAAPFLRWFLRSPTQVSPSMVVFDIEPQQICVFDAETDRVALLARGRSPLVLAVPPGELTWLAAPEELKPSAWPGSGGVP